ncbi:hypothetical protein PAXINDRAFT_19801 [Paxillus involutus ATCC 200175]|uniref:Uncharacterized protein n=1 Tax=Paxillus involutus ATCC 200175 TaxID=664439 RepID=A0A0C9TI58_PAXIN|nr:hypothetical protein PAXINDRAFT_19801 [Paxillus involutus ATCC 200175]
MTDSRTMILRVFSHRAIPKPLQRHSDPLSYASRAPLIAAILLAVLGTKQLEHEIWDGEPGEAMQASIKCDDRPGSLGMVRNWQRQQVMATFASGTGTLEGKT